MRELEELKPCPFCGGDAVTRFIYKDKNGFRYALVQCKTCACKTNTFLDLFGHNGAKDSAYAWNRRVSE